MGRFKPFDDVFLPPIWMKKMIAAENSKPQIDWSGGWNDCTNRLEQQMRISLGG